MLPDWNSVVHNVDGAEAVNNEVHDVNGTTGNAQPQKNPKKDT